MLHPIAAPNSGLSAADIASIVGAAVAVLALWTAGRTVYRNTIGRRADRSRRIARLGTGGQLSFFSSVLGEPPAMRESIAKADYLELLASEDPRVDPKLARAGTNGRHVRKVFGVCTFIDRDYYCHSHCDYISSCINNGYT